MTTFIIALRRAISGIGQDLRYGARALRRSAGLVAWVVGSLAIGMAVTIAALALLNALLVLPFPGVASQEQLVRVAVSRNCGRPDCWTRMSAPADFDALREGLHGLEGLAAYTIGDLAAALPEARSMRGGFVSAGYFEVLGARPAIGRTIDAGDERGRTPVAVLAHSTWAREFGADGQAVGRSIRVGDRFVQIAGVAPEHFSGIDRDRPGGPRSMEAGRTPDLWLPLWLVDDVLPLTDAEQRRGERALSFVGRSRREVDAAQLQAQAEVVARRLAASRGRGGEARAEVLRVWRVNPRHWHLGVLVVMPIPILVLAIACVNAANLMLARGSQRQREIAIRLTIGARRGRVVRQLLVESAILAMLATLIAVPLAWWGLRAVSQPFGTPVPMDRTVLTLTLLTGFGAALAFGLGPAIRLSSQRLPDALGSIAGSRDAVPRQSRMRRALVVAQVTLSVGLLATAWQLVSTVRSQAVSGGTPADRLLIAGFDLQPVRLGTAESESFYRDLVAGALRLPGVEAAGVARHASVWTFGRGSTDASLTVWRPDDAADQGQTVAGGYAGGDLLDAVGLRVTAGRGFTDADRQGRPQAALVNETAARRLGGSPIGSTLRVAPRGRVVTSAIEVRVVGVLEPTVEPRLETAGPPPARLYLPSPLEPEPALSLYVRTRGAAAGIAQPLRELVQRIGPRVPVLEIGTLDEFNQRSYARQLWLARAAAGIGIVGLLLATAGLYAVSSYMVAMRSREIAIRMAIGARPEAILRMVLAQSMRMALIGLLAGSLAAIAASRLIQAEYHGIRGLDRAAFGGAAALFLAAMLIASAVPALRAARLDPIDKLKDA